MIEGNKSHMLAGIGLGSLAIIIQHVILVSLGDIINYNRLLIILVVLDIEAAIYLIAVKEKKRFGIGLLIGYAIPIALFALLFGACFLVMKGF